MSLALTIIAGLIVALLGLIGLWRDVQRGFLSLVGTLLGVVLVQIWGATWSAWLQETFGWTPSTAGWVASSLSFLFVAIFVGYGSALRVAASAPAADSKTKSRGKVLARPAGALLGMLNGALIASVLLLYARDWSANETLQAAISESPVLTLLIDWFPWFILGVALVMGFQALGKWTLGGLAVLGRMSASRQQKQQQPAPQPQAATSQGQPASAASAASAAPAAANTAPAASTAPAAKPSPTPQLTAEQQRMAAKNDAAHYAALRRAADKIDQRLGNQPSDKP